MPPDQLPVAAAAEDPPEEESTVGVGLGLGLGDGRDTRDTDGRRPDGGSARRGGDGRRRRGAAPGAGGDLGPAALGEGHGRDGRVEGGGVRLGVRGLGGDGQGHGRTADDAQARGGLHGPRRAEAGEPVGQPSDAARRTTATGGTGGRGHERDLLPGRGTDQVDTVRHGSGASHVSVTRPAVRRVSAGFVRPRRRRRRRARRCRRAGRHRWTPRPPPGRRRSGCRHGGPSPAAPAAARRS